MTAETEARLQAHFASASVTTISGRIYRGTLPRIICGDGTTMSIQVGSGLYCTPRNDAGPWWAAEVGYPSRALEGLLQSVEDPAHPTDTVYAYVPLSVIAKVIDDCGGFSGTAPRQGGAA